MLQRLYQCIGGSGRRSSTPRRGSAAWSGCSRTRRSSRWRATATVPTWRDPGPARHLGAGRPGREGGVPQGEARPRRLPGDAARGGRGPRAPRLDPRPRPDRAAGRRADPDGAPDRPDVLANRLGVDYAAAGVRLQRANAYSDAYLLYQPYTFQSNAPEHLKSSHSWASA